ncbi:MAG: hypothetical protein O2779_05750 [Nanoarchaeota archaeon]|nr:hypothetical protein [Nanoarchaeota archaeon]
MESKIILSKRGSILDQPWAEVLQMTVLIMFLIFFIPALARACSTIKQSSIESDSIDRFEILVHYLEELDVEAGKTNFPLILAKGHLIKTYTRCSEGNVGIAKTCFPEARACLIFTPNTHRQPYCIDLRSKVGEQISFVQADAPKEIDGSPTLFVQKIALEKSKSGVARYSISITHD